MVDARDGLQYTPLLLAAQEGHAEVCHILERANFEKQVVQWGGMTALAVRADGPPWQGLH